MAAADDDVDDDDSLAMRQMLPGFSREHFSGKSAGLAINKVVRQWRTEKFNRPGLGGRQGEKEGEEAE